MVRCPARPLTVLLGRVNFEGFGGYWPTVADDPSADPRDRTFSRWLDAVEVVFSTTLTETKWSNSASPRTTRSPRSSGSAQAGGDIIVLASASVIRAPWTRTSSTG